ncbi:sterol desaturase family protein [Candidatus Marimicrobium litorale]|uniref:Sterol desaturase family protein n=1 Tax=Candidatus Marimicrobium litorale TaxID=2518991 RepID=A0ABT3T622_9GAMM|nr:sterol desaturase family protein [Candidatus Marimicrobium litorale]MCX2976937.1 sterol desaturase family protein [Candidatus Marimicrobium litorale]
MQELWTEYYELLAGTSFVLFLAYFSLLLSWPFFLLLEKLTPVNRHTPRSNFFFNWKITGSNLLLAPVFNALVILLTLALVDTLGLPKLGVTTASMSIGLPVVDTLLQGMLIFVTACFLGDFSYYWWHRAQHQIPVLWEIHKLHHSDEHLNTTTIYRSHFLEPAGQALVRGLTIGLIFDISETPQTAIAIVAGGLLPVLWDYFIHANVRIDALNRVLPFFSVPQFHWIHHSREPEHQDKNFSIWLPLFDIAFGSYYRPRRDEYPATGLSSGEKIQTLWEAQAGPLLAWKSMLKNRRTRPAKERQADGRNA